MLRCLGLPLAVGSAACLAFGSPLGGVWGCCVCCLCWPACLLASSVFGFHGEPLQQNCKQHHQGTQTVQALLELSGSTAWNKNTLEEAPPLEVHHVIRLVSSILIQPRGIVFQNHIIQDGMPALFNLESTFGSFLLIWLQLGIPLNSFWHHFDALGAPVNYLECPLETVRTSLQFKKTQRDRPRTIFLKMRCPKDTSKGLFFDNLHNFC